MKLKEKVKECARDVMNYASNTACRVGYWCKSNPEIATAIGIALIGAVSNAASTAMKSYGSAAAREQRRISRTYYDTRTGIHWKLRRDATNKDRKAVHDAFMAGDDIYDILKERHLI